MLCFDESSNMYVDVQNTLSNVHKNHQILWNKFIAILWISNLHIKKLKKTYVKFTSSITQKSQQ